MKKIKKFIITLLSVAMIGSTITGCAKDSAQDDSNNQSQGAEQSSKVNYLSKETEKGADDKNPVATIEMEDGGIIKVELFPEIAPNTVRNFISLANSGFYDGLTFHRVIPGFMIQGGDPAGNGSGGPDYDIYGEFSNNDFENDLKHERGVISMARSMDMNSAGSQFFIMHEDSPHLDGDYAAFGKVTEGLDEVDKIASVERDMNDKPKEDVVIKSITVDTFGVEYKEPVHYSK